MPESAPHRGRPRDAARDRALLEATLAVLAESGYGGLTTATVAARAGVSTATLYRRWSSKEELVIAAVSAYAGDLGDHPDTGSLEGDLRDLLRDKAVALTGTSGQLIRTLIGEAAHNDALAVSLTDALMKPVRRRVDDIVRRAVARGDIAPLADSDLVGDLVIGPVVSLFTLAPVPPDHVPVDEATAAADRLLPFVMRAMGAKGTG
ncbi:TetR/AcrR family transcriptional regulator [Streptomyces sp. NPDC090106]|uniref:TetR/AcrR family transcriptional regulator n=1 Tax=Streptomyces sp. NPDC090106 TaxID=3365946 RepID=UPI00380463E8